MSVRSSSLLRYRRADTSMRPMPAAVPTSRNRTTPRRIAQRYEAAEGMVVFNQ
jgi:hypothetical protein